MKSFEIFNLVNICRKGIENRKVVSKRTFSRGLKVFIYNISVALFSPTIGRVAEIFLVNGKSQNKLILDISNSKKIYHGFVYSKVTDIFDLPTLYCQRSIFQRLCKLIEWSFQFISHKNEIEVFSAWIELCSLCDFLVHSGVKEVIGRGHYDEFSTWLGELSKILDFKYIIYQHGVEFGDIDLPNKIYCDSVNTFDNYSSSVFRKHIISNDLCNYSIYNFQPSVLFVDIPKKERGMIYIGIAEQCNPDWINLVIKSLEVDKRLYLIVMKHPLSSMAYIINHGLVDDNNKYFNVDYLLTEHSTIAIDYYRAKSPAKIIFTSPLIIDAFKEYPFIYYSDLRSIGSVILGGTK